jgi:RimJ/RimL family protein N-acetyltransferase
MIEGELVRLRPLTPDDLNDVYLSWLHDPDVTRYMEAGRFPTTLDDLRAYYDAHQPPDHVLWAIETVSSGTHIGNLTLDFDWVHRRAELGIMVGERGLWGQGFGPEAVRLAVRWAFTRLNLRKVGLGVLAVNAGAIRAYEKAGLHEEGRLREHAFCEGQYVDVVRMAIFRNEVTTCDS